MALRESEHGKKAKTFAISEKRKEIPFANSFKTVNARKESVLIPV